MKFQLVSDLHLEFAETIPEVESHCDTLFLAGDLGYPNKPSYEEFLTNMSNKFQHVYLVAGNHEFYRNDYHTAKQQLRKVCSQTGVHFLDRKSVVHHDQDTNQEYRVVGCTLWSHVPTEHETIVSKTLNDYRMIQYTDPVMGHKRMLKVSDTNQFHKEDVQFIEQEIEAGKQGNQRVIVLGHHGPLANGCSWPHLEASPITTAFQTDLTHLLGDPVDAFLFGHTHFNADLIVNGTRVLSNQQGYQNEKLRWNPSQVFQLQ